MWGVYMIRVGLSCYYMIRVGLSCYYMMRRVVMLLHDEVGLSCYYDERGLSCF